MAKRDSIVVVTGLPRSGTSMMMAMLEAGGIPALTDDVRQADAGNPMGYLEFTAAKSLARDHTWLNCAVGRAVKIISFHLFHAPPSFAYRLVFMERPLPEVLASQRALLRTQGKIPQANAENLADLYTRHLAHVKQWLERQPNFSVLYVPYPDTVRHPHEAALRVGEFLGAGLDTAAMAAMVRPALHRQRGPGGGEPKSHGPSTTP